MSTANLSQPAPDAGSAYRYKRFTTRLLFRDMRFSAEAARHDDAFPLFELISTHGNRLLNRDVFGDKPVLFIFGSMTCPMTASAMPSLQALYDEFGDHVDFILLYVREAHPGECFPQADTMAEKLKHAQALEAFYEMPWTVAVDNIDGKLHRRLDPKPNSAFLTNSEGTILFRSLWAADKAPLRVALEATSLGQIPEKKQSESLVGPVIRAMGKVQEVMKLGGPQAVRDLWRAAFPMALTGWVATLFSPLSPDQRGIAAVLSLTVGTSAILAAWAYLMV